jgi:hypothetical protein
MQSRSGPFDALQQQLGLNLSDRVIGFQAHKYLEATWKRVRNSRNFTVDCGSEAHMATVLEQRVQLPSLAEDNGEVTVDKIVYAVQRIVEIANPVRVVAFGSRARKDHHRESDLDLAVVVDTYDPRKGLPPINRVNLDVWMPMDLVVYDVARDRQLRDCLNSLEAEVAREGRTLYERNQGFIDRGTIERLV